MDEETWAVHIRWGDGLFKHFTDYKDVRDRDKGEKFGGGEKSGEKSSGSGSGEKI